MEHAFAFSADGEPLFHRTTEAVSRVSFDSAALALLPGAILTHNHPGGRSFSEEDVTFAMRVGLAEMRVVTAKSRFILRPPAETWSWLLLKSFPAVLKMGIRSRRETDFALHHLLWERVSRRGVIDYRVDPW